MKKFLSVVVGCLVVGGVAIADVAVDSQAAGNQVVAPDSFEMAMSVSAKSDGKPASGASKAKAGPCSQVNLTQTQKDQIKTAVTAFRQTKVTLNAQAKTARVNYAKLAADAKADYALAQTAGQNVAAAAGQELAAKMALKTQVLFQILTPAQRGPALQCERMAKRHMQARKGGQGRRGGHPKSKAKGGHPESEE